jgi:hypothetical protein
MKLSEIINSMDWKLLREQKLHILGLLERAQSDYIHATDEPILLPEEKEALDGVLNLLDAIQDCAVDEVGLPSDVIFGKSED